MNTKNNKVFQENEQAIREAFLTLLERETDRVISVKDICEMSGINRSTFYRHYLDVYDLMEKTERSIFGEWFLELSKTGEVENRFHSRDTILILLRQVVKNRIFYGYYIKNHPDALKESAFLTIWEEFFIPYFKKWGVENKKDMEYYFTYYQGGLKSVVLKWIEEGCVETPEHVVDIIDMVSKGLRENV